MHLAASVSRGFPLRSLAAAAVLAGLTGCLPLTIASLVNTGVQLATGNSSPASRGNNLSPTSSRSTGGESAMTMDELQDALSDVTTRPVTAACRGQIGNQPVIEQEEGMPAGCGHRLVCLPGNVSPVRVLVCSQPGTGERPEIQSAAYRSTQPAGGVARWSWREQASP